jgi:hypothetical protein
MTRALPIEVFQVLENHGPMLVCMFNSPSDAIHYLDKWNTLPHMVYVHGELCEYPSHEAMLRMWKPGAI